MRNNTLATATRDPGQPESSLATLASHHDTEGVSTVIGRRTSAQPVGSNDRATTPRRPRTSRTRQLLATSTVVVALATGAIAADRVAAAPERTGAFNTTTAADSTTSPTASAAGDPNAPQSPFLCTTEFNGLGQPLVDNQAKRGTPVYPVDGAGEPDRTQDPLGWSEQCQVEEVTEYRYRSTDGGLKTLAPGAGALPADIVMLDAADLLGTDQMALDGATQVPYLIRFQRGTLPTTRFLYSIAMLAPFEEYQAVTADPTAPRSVDHWNGRLLFSFSGGVGIGHSQGDLSTGAATQHEAMRLGHAVVFSSGTRTSTHYNLMLGGRTAIELKARFVDQYGDPTYTVGIGGSGGGIQQYVYGQNLPGLLDAAIPQYSYPDMTTQTINVGDCELLEHYMDVLDAGNPRWANWDNRKILQGQNTIEGFTSDWQARTGDTGSSECIEGWRGATPLAMNPTFGLAVDMDDALMPFLPELIDKLSSGQPPYPDDFPDLGRLLRVHEDRSQWVDWSHWDDTVEVYGVDPASGYARVPWDNVGVQYGLRAVADGTITPEEFLKLNAQIGSWKEPEDNVAESCGMVKAMAGDEIALLGSFVGLCQGDELDQYSSRQMNFSTDPYAPAPRRSGDVAAITAAFSSGLVFGGSMPREIPIIDARHYLEHELDMHNAHQSFVVRERIKAAEGHADNQVIWFLDARPTEDDDATDRLFDLGFRVMDEWMLNIAANPGLSVAAARPTDAVDRCWNTDGSEIASGDDVWSGANELVLTGAGAWSGSAPATVAGVPVGACSARFPLHSTSRVVAGGPITNDVYKCHTKSVAHAIADGDYGVWEPTVEERARLEAIHPEGVCDYGQRSVGYPGDPLPTPPTSPEPGGPTTTSTTPDGSTSTTEPVTTTTGHHTTTTSPSGGGSSRPGSGSSGASSGSGGYRGSALARTGLGVLGLTVVGFALFGSGTVLNRGARRRHR